MDKKKVKPLNKRRGSGKKEGEPRSSAKKGKQRPVIWIRPEALRWYILLGLSVIIAILLFPNILTVPRSYELGDVADRDIKASREFLIENKELTEANREKAVRAALSVYDFDPAATDVISRIQEAFQAGREFLNKVTAGPPAESDTSESVSEDQTESLNAFKKQFCEILQIPYNESLVNTFIKNDFSREAEEAIIALDRQVFNRGVVGNKVMLMNQADKGVILHDIRNGKETRITDLDRFYDQEEAREFVNKQGDQLLSTLTPKGLAEASLELAVTMIKPNVTFNKRETTLRVERARESVKPFYFKVKKGEMLIREGERVTREHLLKLSAQYEFLKQKDMLGRVPAMAVLFAFLFSAMYLVGLFKTRSTSTEIRDLLFHSTMLLVTFIVVIATNFVAEEMARGFHFFSSRALLFAIPVASGAILISIFHGIRVAASFSLIISILAALVVDGRIEFFMYFFISSLVGASGVKVYRERGIFIKAGLKVGVCNVVLALSIAALYGTLFTGEAAVAMGAALLGGILVGVISTGILPLIEMSFGYTTDVKLLELANLDQPLLRDLMVQAPGTYHHSVIVSNLVEASARAINANPLLAKVAAYYHDIGKMRKPLYFIENQVGQENKHEKLAPSMSSLILISHVKDGVDLAKQYKLGREIIDIIRQHHGRSLITYFYDKAIKQGEKKGGKSSQVKEENFRYPGPKPQSKEAALVMLADGVEAASKSLRDPTAARIQGMVQKIIKRAFSDGQLDECELTLKDLHEIAKSFNQTLSGIFHHRIQYPEAEDVAASVRQIGSEKSGKNGAARKGENGYTDKRSAGGSPDKSQNDTPEAGEDLKRLGL
ncbi:MAG: HDIG domain-containing protein [Desulfatiglandaceae bacterium]